LPDNPTSMKLLGSLTCRKSAILDRLIMGMESNAVRGGVACCNTALQTGRSRV
jgi:hypothetical protein